MKKELKNIVIAHVERTFRIMFDVAVQPVPDFVFTFNDDDLITKVEMHQNGVNVIIRFAFPRPMLKPLLLKIYPPALAVHEMAYEDAACEIANIICNGLKTFLNENGYALSLEIPQIDYTDIKKFKAAESAEHMNLNFILEEDGFTVDLVMDSKGKKIPDGKDQKV